MTNGMRERGAATLRTETTLPSAPSKLKVQVAKTARI
jgi:hypothetical protein